MSTTSRHRRAPARRTPVPRRPRLVSAEFLKLRKRRGLVLSGLALTVLPMLVAYTVLLIRARREPCEARARRRARELCPGRLDLLTTLGAIAAILIGATLGAGDLSSGVFRELVVTGRSRLALFAARIPAGLALVWAFVARGLRHHRDRVDRLRGVARGARARTLLVETAAWLALVTALSLGARARHRLGSSARAEPRSGSCSAGRSSPPRCCSRSSRWAHCAKACWAPRPTALAPAALFDGHEPRAMSLAAAVLVIAAWTVVPLALGAWRTVTRDA